MACTPSNKRILIQCPESIKNSWSTAPSEIFEVFDSGGGDSNYLVIFTNPVGGWVQKNNYITSEPSLKFSSRTSVLDVYRANRIFEASVGDCRYELLGVLEEISGNSNAASIGPYTPITFLDFNTPEFEDFKSNPSDPFTVRNGVLVLTDRGSNVGFANSSQYVKGGFKFKILENKLRVI